MFRHRIKELRDSKGLSQGALGKQLNISQSAVGMWESGERMPSVDVLEMVADYFSVSVDYLLGKTSIKKTPSLNSKEERDIKSKLDETLRELELEQDALMFDGEPLDDTTKELLIASIKNSMEIAKIKAKERYNPNKNK